MSDSTTIQSTIQSLRQALADAEARHGPDHLETAHAAHRLAISRRHDGRAGADEAEALLMQAINIYEQAPEVYHGHLALPLSLLASIRDMQGRKSEAEAMLRRSIELQWDEENGEDDMDSGDELQHLGILLSEQGRFVEAAEFLNRSLRAVERCSGDDTPYLGQHLRLLARAYVGLKQFDEAIELLQRELALCRKHTPDETDTLGELLEEIASCHTKAGHHAEADESLQEAHGLRAQLDVELGERYGSGPFYDPQGRAMENLLEQANALAARDDFEGAIALGQQVLAHRAARFDLPHAQPDLHQKLAKWYAKLKRYPEALTLLEQSRTYHESKVVAIYEEPRLLSEHGVPLWAGNRPKSPPASDDSTSPISWDVLNARIDDVRRLMARQRAAPTWLHGSTVKTPEQGSLEGLASTCYDLGSVLYQAGQSDKALESLQRSVSIWRVTHAEIPSILSYGLTQMAEVHAQRGEWDRAAELIEEALERERAWQPDSSFVVSLMENLSVVRERQGRIEEAAQLHVTVAEKQLQNEGPAQPEVLLEFNRAGNLFLKLALWDRAKSCYQRSLAFIREAHLETNQPLVGVLLNLAFVELQQRRHAEALPYLREALPICEADQAILGREYEAVLRRLTESLVMTKHFDEAEPVILRWLAHLDRHLPNSDPAIPAALAYLAQVYHNLRMHEQALPLIERAIPLVERCAIPGGPSIANYFHIQAAILTHLGRHAEARSATTRAREIEARDKST